LFEMGLNISWDDFGMFNAVKTVEYETKFDIS
jgi:hypothetical protein